MLPSGLPFYLGTSVIFSFLLLQFVVFFAILIFPGIITLYTHTLSGTNKIRGSLACICLSHFLLFAPFPSPLPVTPQTDEPCRFCFAKRCAGFKPSRLNALGCTKFCTITLFLSFSHAHILYIFVAMQGFKETIATTRIYISDACFLFRTVLLAICDCMNRYGKSSLSI